MSTKTPQKEFLDQLQSIKSKCDLTEDNFTALAELGCLPTGIQVSGIRTAIKDSKKDIAIAQAEGKDKKDILSSHTTLTEADIENYDGLLAAIEWLSGNSVTQTQAKAIFQLAQSKVQITENQIAALDPLQVDKQQLLNIARYSMTIDAKDIVTLIQIDNSITLESIQNAINAIVDKNSSLKNDQKKAIKNATESTNILKLSAEDVFYLAQLDDNVITEEGIKAIQGLVNSFFNDENYPELTTRNFLACLEKGSKQDISNYTFSKEGLALVVDSGVFADEDTASLQALYDVAVALSPTISSITSKQKEQLKAVSEGPVFITAQVTLLDNLRTGGGSLGTTDDLTAYDVMTLKKIVDANVSLSTATTSLASTITGQQLTIGTVTLTAAEVTSTLKASASISTANPITTLGVSDMLKLIPSKDWVDALYAMKVAGATDDNIAAISGFNSDSATDANNYGIVVVDFAQIGTGTSAITTDTQVTNVRAAYPTSNPDPEARMVEIIKVGASDPSPIEVKVQDAVNVAAAVTSATITSVKSAAIEAAAGGTSEVLKAIIDAANDKNASVDSLKVAAGKAFEASTKCPTLRSLAELTGITSEADSAPVEVVSKVNTFTVNEMLQISGNCTLSGDVVNVMIKALGRDDGVETTCDLTNKELKDYVLSAQALVAQYLEAEMEEVVGAAFNNGTEAMVNQALGLCNGSDSNPDMLKLRTASSSNGNLKSKVVEYCANEMKKIWIDALPALAKLQDSAKQVLFNFVDTSGDVAADMTCDLLQLLENTQSKFFKRLGIESQVELATENLCGLNSPLSNVMVIGIIDGILKNMPKSLPASYVLTNVLKELKAFIQQGGQQQDGPVSFLYDSSSNAPSCPEIKQTPAAECVEDTGSCDKDPKVFGAYTNGVLSGQGAVVGASKTLSFDKLDYLTSSSVIIGNQSLKPSITLSDSGSLHFIVKDITAKNVNCAKVIGNFSLSLPPLFEGKVKVKVDYDDEFSLIFKNTTLSSQNFDSYNSILANDSTATCDNGGVEKYNHILQSNDFSSDGEQFDFTLLVGGTGQIDIAFELQGAA